ncbi:MAG: glycosyltransferase family 9 protein [Gemmatimonadetes bacterium]|jgi:ADP-heptose:LPS heptosyltransferase|nr:glycosyltransferase family 9 protein [Gemmatimonadota bacterium]
MTAKTVCLLRPDKAGDSLKTLPALRALQAARPDLELHVVCSHHNHSVLEPEPLAGLHLLSPEWKEMIEETGEPLFASGAPPEHFDIAINLLCDPFPETDALLAGISATEKFTASKAAATRANVHLVSFPRGTPAGADETINIAGIISQSLQTDLCRVLPSVPRSPRLLPQDLEEAEETLGQKHGKWLALCPFAGVKPRNHPNKRWEAFLTRMTYARWKRFLARITQGGGAYSRYFLFGLPQNAEQLKRMRRASPLSDSIQICFPSSFRALGAYLKRMDGVVAVDSGPLHLARSFGLPSLGFLSGGDQERWFAGRVPGELLLRRGLLDRYPMTWEMVRAFRRWEAASSATGPGF